MFKHFKDINAFIQKRMHQIDKKMTVKTKYFNYIYIYIYNFCTLMRHSQTQWRPNRRKRSHTLSNTSFCPFWRLIDTLKKIWYMGKTTMKSDFYLKSSTVDLQYPKCWCGAEGREGVLGEVCTVVFWTAARKSLMAMEFGQEKCRLEVSEEAGICGSRSTSVCVLLGWLHFVLRF